MSINKILLALVIVLILIIIGVIIIFELNQKTSSNSQSPISSPISFSAVDNTAQTFSADLEVAFQKAISESNLPEKSTVMVESYFGMESQEININFTQKENNKNQFYMASTIKPLYFLAVINLLNIQNLETRIPFKFADDPENMGKIALELSEYITYQYPADSLLVDFIVPILREANVSTSNEILSTIKTNPKITGFTFSFKDIIKYTLGPSSNWGLSILRNYLAVQKSVDEKSASDLVETYLNDYLKTNNYPGDLVINLSTKAAETKTFNTDNFYEIEFLFQSFYENRFSIPKDIFENMKTAMKLVAPKPLDTNQRHELKSIAAKVINNANIIEKTGYIGLDFEAAPTLNQLNGWATMPSQEGKRIVIFNATSFARIYLTNDKFVQFNYSIAAPFYLSLDPDYEELNNDYLVPKNKINEALEKNILPVFEKYKDSIAVNN